VVASHPLPRKALHPNLESALEVPASELHHAHVPIHDAELVASLTGAYTVVQLNSVWPQKVDAHVYAHEVETIDHIPYEVHEANSIDLDSKGQMQEVEHNLDLQSDWVADAHEVYALVLVLVLVPVLDNVGLHSSTLVMVSISSVLDVVLDNDVEAHELPGMVVSEVLAEAGVPLLDDQKVEQIVEDHVEEQIALQPDDYYNPSGAASGEVVPEEPMKDHSTEQEAH
jgi:hypothetical protein